ncbi:MAG: Hsp20/alpha crystallin family protein [Gammaproteobacteria bacterium]|nr:Hsp20/alpha crystallin family protein [Gammaproteobacteria bacterium]
MFERIWGYENPLSGQIRRLEQELDQLFGNVPSLVGTRDIRSLPAGGFPALNVGSTTEAITVYLFAPGVDPKKLDISMHQNLLTVSGERELQQAEEATYYRRERYSGEFRRSISLPEDVDPERVEARYLDGILTVTIARRPSDKPRQIKVG